MLVFLAFLCIFMSACTGASNEEEQPVTSVVIQKDDTIVATIVEEFEKDYYAIDGLKDLINSSIQDFKREYPEGIVELQSVEFLDNTDGVRRVKTVIKYDNAKTYKEFNKEDMFYGTIQEAFEAGYNLNVTLQSAVDTTKYPDIKKQDILDMSDKHILIMEENMLVSSYYKLSYVSEGVEVIDKKHAEMNHAGNNAMIIFNK